ncbi:hypothetical protein BDY19DRAFT_910952, partial [Irpex rosettiformis]
MSTDFAAPNLPRPTLFWAGPDSVLPQGLYVTPNSIVPPQRKSVQNNAFHERYPDPWCWYFPSLMSGPALERYWTCLLPKKQTFDGVFDPLEAIDVVPFQNTSGREMWRLPSAVAEKAFDSRKWAVNHVRKIRAVFMMWIVQIQFLAVLSSKDKDAW